MIVLQLFEQRTSHLHTDQGLNFIKPPLCMSITLRHVICLSALSFPPHPSPLQLKHAKAVVARKGQVRSVQQQSAPYGGEATGIRSTISRSVRFGK